MNQGQPLVECHSEYQYAERPTAFLWKGERLAVTQVIARWHSPHGTHFKVLTTDHGIFELTYYELEGIWEVQQP